jgi:SAM-dependent methyltransferase/putative flippase GtrA
MKGYWRLFLRYLAVGGLNTAVGYASYAAFVLVGAPLWLAVSGSTMLGFLFNFISYGRLVFGSTSYLRLPRFFIFYSGIGVLNFALLRVLTRLDIGPLWAQAVLLPMLAAIGFFGMRSFVFGGIGAALRHEESMIRSPVIEDFKPIPVRRSSGILGNARFYLRLLVDLQLLTCLRFLAPRLPHLSGALLDVGCGEMPFRTLLGPGTRYTGIDVPREQAFGMCENPDIVAFNGRAIPFPDASFDHVLCTEVLEHAEDPSALVAEMLRVLRPGGTLLATVPFSARVHHAPYDFHRFTRFRLATLFSGFAYVEVEERGDDLAVIANKLIVVAARLARPRPIAALLWRLPMLVSLVPGILVALLVAHLSIMFGWGSRMDPLGYGVTASKG